MDYEKGLQLEMDLQLERGQCPLRDRDVSAAELLWVRFGRPPASLATTHEDKVTYPSTNSLQTKMSTENNLIIMKKIIRNSH